jgi:mRNA-degrading endonuclease toxin of MazEF toxin-antitoxin module
MVPVMCAGRHAVAVIDQIRAVSKARLDRRIGALAAEELAAVEAALRDVLEL